MSENSGNGEQSVTLDQAQGVSVPAPKPDKLSQREKRHYEHLEHIHDTELGLMGKFWGSKSEKPGNVSAILLIILTIFVGGIIFCRPPVENFSDIFAGLTSIITLILGYLFGSSDRR